MRALSVKNPWASLIASGRKTIELRTWSTSYRGPVIILSSAKPSSTLEAMAWDEHRRAPTSRAVALVELLDVRPVRPTDDAHRACCQPNGDEFAWCLRLVRRLRLKEHVKGKLSLFRPDANLITLVTRAR